MAKTQEMVTEVKVGKSKADKIFDTCNYIFMSIILLIVLYPLYLVIISSFSEPTAVNGGEVLFWIHGFTVEGYEMILNTSAVWRGYGNSLLYTALDVALALLLVIPAGYALARKDLPGRNIITFFIAFTMFFTGGLIPTYLLVRNLGMVNTIWALFVPSAVTAFNLIIVRTFFQTTIPTELLDSAKVDGCSNRRFFISIVLPLSAPIIAVIALFNAVNQWNAYFPALIYLRDQSLYPLQLVLRNILLANQMARVSDAMIDPELIQTQRHNAQLIKYALIMVASVPMLILYPFLQRYFVKGVMIGSIKG